MPTQKKPSIKPSHVRKHWSGFVPMSIPHTQALCAYYHCTSKRWCNRRYCKKHALEYDQEALKGQSVTLLFRSNAS